MLYLFHEGRNPLGLLDFETGGSITINDVQGGMLGVMAEVDLAATATQTPLGDGYDEYGAFSGTKGVKTALTPVPTADKPAFIFDDGDTGYGTMFGHQFGHDSGSADNKYYHGWRSGSLVGPNTLKGSGKVTGWFTPGVYGTDFYTTYAPDADDQTYQPGDQLKALIASAKFNPAGELFAPAYLISFLGDPSLVSTSFSNYSGADTAAPVMMFMWTGGIFTSAGGPA